MHMCVMLVIGMILTDIRCIKQLYVLTESYQADDPCLCLKYSDTSNDRELSRCLDALDVI